MVLSTVYGNQDILIQVAAILRQSYGYEVIMSKEGSVYVSIANIADKKAACLKAVEDCDLFLGIIFPRYGSGITHDEFKEAVRLDKPRWFVTHEKIEYLRKLFDPYLYNKQKVRTKFELKKNSVLDSIKVVDMYNDVRQNWIQPFTNDGELLFFIEQQFEDHNKRLKEINKR